MHVVTFYSYKGGVGRTMALTNVAALLARSGRRVLVVDFDLEAPGVPSYGSLHCARAKPGIVDFVQHYAATGEVPEAARVIVRCQLDDEHPIWVMPAGDNSSPDYSGRLASIDWGDLYANRHGALLLEHLKEQWRTYEGVGFDYVLVDSRTGNTDEGGICTRQLPDAVVVMFAPTRQNIDGLEPIVDGIRQESGSRERAIDMVFCPSNLPDVFDEDDILGRLLAASAARLGYGDPTSLDLSVVQVHHWTNMELLEQPLIVESREKSRLSNEYRELRMAIIGQNPADREGAAFALQRMPRVYEAARNARDGEAAKKVLDRTGEIAALHADDGHLAMLAAQVFSAAGDYEREERSLSMAIRTGTEGDRARVLRAIARANLNRRADALEDVRAVLSSPNGSSFEFMPAVQILRGVAEDPIQEALAIFRRDETRARAKNLLAPILMQRREHLDLVSKELLATVEHDGMSPQQQSDIRNTATLALIGAGRYAEAIRLSAADSGPDNLAALFNLAIARWGEDGSPPRDMFSELERSLPEQQEANQNLHQCTALVRAVVGRPDAAIEEIGRAEDRIVATAIAFSCWTFTYRDGAGFQADLAQMRDLVAAGEIPKPPFLDGRDPA